MMSGTSVSDLEDDNSILMEEPIRNIGGGGWYFINQYYAIYITISQY